MKKVILIFTILFIISPIAKVFAEITRVQSGNGVDVEWKFEPEVSTYAGYNLDWGHFGMEGKAKLTLKNEIRAKKDEEFTGDEVGTVYAKIEIEDLEIKFEVEGAQGQGRDDDELVKKTVKVMGKDEKEYEVLTKDTKTKGKQGVRVKWGDINATVYIGPAYIQLKSKEHEKVGYVSNLSDMDFVTIREDVVTPRSTARYQSTELLFKKDKDIKTSDSDSDSVAKRTLSYKGSDINNEGMNKQLAAFKVGFKMDKLVDVAVGFSMKYSFKESLATSDGKKHAFNPFALSLGASILVVENLTLKLKNAYIFSKVKDDKINFLGEGNPLSLGAFVGYKMNIGDSLFVKPSLGFDVALENKAPYGKDLDTKVEPPKRSTKDVLTASYAIGAGVTLGFQDAGRYLVKSKDDDDVMDLFKGDEKIIDGVGLGFLYGSTPYDKVRDISIPYIGMKATLWDSEDGDIIGWIPGLQHGLIFNFNYALGAKKKVDDVEYNIKPTADVGLGYEGSYTVSFIKLKAGTLFKAFNITDVKKDFVTNAKGKEESFERKVANPFDLRVRFGVDIVKLVPNTTFEIMWESGDLLRTNDSSVASDGYHKTENFFRAKETGTGADGAESKAQYGYIYAGVKVEF